MTGNATSLRWVLFDMNGTLLDPGGIAETLGGGEDNDHIVRNAFAEALLHAMADTLSGAHRPLPEHLRAALERQLIANGRSTERLNAAMHKAARLDPFPDAAAAVDRLRGAGLHVAVLTNSATDSAEASLSAAGLRETLDAVIGSDGPGVFKPHPDVYRHGLDQIGAAPQEACMVAAHGWDLMGAKRVGLRTAWVARTERHLPATIPPPDVQGTDLAAVAERIATQLIESTAVNDHRSG